MYEYATYQQLTLAPNYSPYSIIEYFRGHGPFDDSAGGGIGPPNSSAPRQRLGRLIFQLRPQPESTSHAPFSQPKGSYQAGRELL